MKQLTDATALSSRWQQHIDHWQTSGLSGAGYCREHGLTYHCFIYWRRKFDNAAAEQSTQIDPDVQALSAFVAVQPPSSLAVSRDDLHLCLPNGLEVRNIYANNLSNVRSLLEQL